MKITHNHSSEFIRLNWRRLPYNLLQSEHFVYLTSVGTLYLKTLMLLVESNSEYQEISSVKAVLFYGCS